MAKKEKVRCVAKTKTGKKCKKPVVGKSKYCATHRKK
jgi:hypothetical protein